jgi:hypothetical protein
MCIINALSMSKLAYPRIPPPSEMILVNETPVAELNPNQRKGETFAANSRRLRSVLAKELAHVVVVGHARESMVAVLRLASLAHSPSTFPEANPRW